MFVPPTSVGGLIIPPTEVGGTNGGTSMNITYLSLPYAKLTLDQLYAILRLRAEVFVVEQDCVYQDLDDKDPSAIHLMGMTEDGRLAAYTRIVDKGVSYAEYASIGRVITAPFARGKGLGRPLMQESLRVLFQAFGQQKVKISAQAHLQGYYESVGFKPVGEGYDEDGIPHIGMVYAAKSQMLSLTKKHLVILFLGLLLMNNRELISQPDLDDLLLHQDFEIQDFEGENSKIVYTNSFLVDRHNANLETINGEFLSVLSNLFAKRGDLLYWKEPIRLRDKFSLTIKTFDPSKIDTLIEKLLKVVKTKAVYKKTVTMYSIIVVSDGTVVFSNNLGSNDNRSKHLHKIMIEEICEEFGIPFPDWNTKHDFIYSSTLGFTGVIHAIENRKAAKMIPADAKVILKKDVADMYELTEL
ncbi:GNAT family N-acetyltransferase [Neolewinella agarilytica]|uniref:Predicted N-acyltransferase, GNAT family n=1 Tax=Neolewinella agarilytica TaxID=478744 RepID=A0A1H9IYT0_9BACT|nr:GNAT family N-acetyltransferase [Neolewinella agarilytica]SEQ79555.1 Predicted N-acyltransferase, GNAT family [Neolewinella agarilytica]